MKNRLLFPLTEKKIVLPIIKANYKYFKLTGQSVEN